MGCRTIVLSTPGRHPGIALADVFLPVDITDPAAVLAAARDHGVTAVATAGTDHGLPALGAVVDALGLPGPGAAAARASRDKLLAKKALEAAGVPCARGEAAPDPGAARACAERLGYPVVVKPAASSGSRGVTVVTGPGGVASAWEAARAAAPGTVLVEERLTGREFGAQAVVHGKRVVAVVPHRDTVTTEGPPTPIGHALPWDRPPTEAGRTAEVVERAVAALGLRDCLANVDLMMTAGGPRVLELAGRVGATGIPEMIAHHHGWDVYGHLVGLALGEHPALPAVAGRPNAVLLVRSARSGRVKSLEVPADIANHPDLVDLRWDVGIGDPVRAFAVGPDRIGHLQAAGPDARTCERTAATFHRRLVIEVEE